MLHVPPDSKAFAAKRCFVPDTDRTDPAKAWKQVLHETGYSRVCPLMISGALKGGTFFRCTGVRLAPKAMRNALEFELPQRLLQDAETMSWNLSSLQGTRGVCRSMCIRFRPPISKSCGDDYSERQESRLLHLSASGFA
ncbi:MAG: hypothetical protein V8T87_03920 [Victivallales bacterium]